MMASRRQSGQISTAQKVASSLVHKKKMKVRIWVATLVLLLVGFFFFQRSEFYLKRVVLELESDVKFSVVETNNRLFAVHVMPACSEGGRGTLFCDEVKRRIVGGWERIPTGGGIGIKGSYCAGGNGSNEVYQVFFGFTSNPRITRVEITFVNELNSDIVSVPIVSSAFFVHSIDTGEHPPYRLEKADYYEGDRLVYSEIRENVPLGE